VITPEPKIEKILINITVCYKLRTGFDSHALPPFNPLFAPLASLNSWITAPTDLFHFHKQEIDLEIKTEGFKFVTYLRG
jgi:hypothetical protein